MFPYISNKYLVKSFCSYNILLITFKCAFSMRINRIKISAIQDIIADLKHGKMVILVDEEDRENEGDLVLAADFVTPKAINFMATHGRGLICLTLTEEKCHQLD